jgi:hypothetical protein
MLKGSIINDILGDACRKRKLSSVDTDEDRHSATSVLLSDFLSRLILSDSEIGRVGRNVLAIDSYSEVKSFKSWIFIVLRKPLKT